MKQRARFILRLFQSFFLAATLHYFDYACAAETSPTQTASGIIIPADVSFRQARDRETEKDYEGAIRLYKKHLTLHPADDDARIALARTYLAVEQDDAAMRELEPVLKRTPESVDALLLSGLIDLRKKDFASARTKLEKVVSIAPKYCEAYTGLANSYLWEDRKQEAVDILRRGGDHCSTNTAFAEHRKKMQEDRSDARRRAPDAGPARKGTTQDRGEKSTGMNFDAMILQARKLMRSERPAEAHDILDQILAVNPDYADAMLLKGTLAIRLKDYAAARYWYDRTLAVDPDYCDAWYGISNVLIACKDYAEAWAAIGMRPQCWCETEGIAQQGRVANAAGSYREAKELFLQAHERNPENPDYMESAQNIHLFSNTTTAEYESFELTGSRFYLADFLTYRPHRRLSYDLIAEHFRRTKETTQRAGAGITYQTCEELWLHFQALSSLDEALVPSRYEADLTYQLPTCWKTSLLAGAAFLHADEDKTWVTHAGLRQPLTDEISLEYRHYRASPEKAEATRSNVVRLVYEREKERTIMVGVARGGEGYNEDRVGLGDIAGSYEADSVFGSWREWVCEDWGFILSAGDTKRSNGNDSRMIGIGLFFEF